MISTPRGSATGAPIACLRSNSNHTNRLRKPQPRARATAPVLPAGHYAPAAEDAGTRRARVVDLGEQRPPEPNLTMFAVLWRAGVFLALTGVVYLVCLQLIKMEERREARKRTR